MWEWEYFFDAIGRGSNFDVNPSFDKAISKEGDAVLTYDSHSKKFFITLAACVNYGKRKSLGLGGACTRKLDFGS